MSTRLKILVVWWFVVQITLPFTAPLQTVDLTDLFGQRSQQQATRLTPELCSVPTPARRPTMATPHQVATLSPVVFALTLLRDPAIGWRGTSSPGFMTLPRLQQTVLRL